MINNTIIPGPGHYTLSGTMIHPNVTTYSNSQNIIIKLNSCGTQPFTSKRERFSSNNNEMPGPGECKYFTKKIHMAKPNLETDPS